LKIKEFRAPDWAVDSDEFRFIFSASDVDVFIRSANLCFVGGEISYMTKSYSLDRGAKAAKSSLLDARLVTYLAAAGATVVGTQAASAALVSRTIDVTVFEDDYLLDVDGDTTPDFVFVHESDIEGQTANVAGTNANNQVAVKDESVSLEPKAERLGPGAYVPTSDMYVGAKIADSNMPDDWEGSSGFLGIQFETEAGIHYGFIEMSVEQGTGVIIPSSIGPLADQPLAIHLQSVTYDDTPGVGVTVPGGPAGAVPEPVGLGSLAMGAAGVAALRRRRKA
jgi:hypothetical protein